MFRNIFFVVYFSCAHLLLGKEPLPTLILRPQTSQEAFSFVQYLADRLPWFKENGYTLALPTHPSLEVLYKSAQQLSKHEKSALQEVFYTQIYNEHAFDLSLSKLKDAQDMVHESLKQLSALSKNWSFDLKEQYQIVLTLYRPGGTYNTRSGTVTLLTTENGTFQRNHVAETILHEIVHIGIEESIVQKYKLADCEKERIVDLICHYCLNETLPEYGMQSKGDRRVDDFVNKYTILHDLPAAITHFIEQYPR